MKIFCIGRNYVEHAHELNNAVPTKPLVFMKPDTALLLGDKPFYYPEFTKDLHYEGELVLRISKAGKHIESQFAHKYYDQIAFGIDFTARDVQDDLKKKGQPWEIAKGFDSSAVLSNFIPLSGKTTTNIGFQMFLNGTMVQDGNSSNMIFDCDTIVSYISQFFTLKVGDLIYTGTPAGVGPVKVGDLLEGYLEGQKMLSCEIM
jgi:2-keto-4-pentenoate hydratase/2-oxohepta-3-ene-1,7-dioic acid hydratase in catechol pathway